jgi:hypothetical protein
MHDSKHIDNILGWPQGTHWVSEAIGFRSFGSAHGPANWPWGHGARSKARSRPAHFHFERLGLDRMQIGDGGQ